MLRAARILVLLVPLSVPAACSRGPGPATETVVLRGIVGDVVDLQMLAQDFERQTGGTLKIQIATRTLDDRANTAYDEVPDVLLAAALPPLQEAADDNALRRLDASAAISALPSELRDPDTMWVAVAADPLVVLRRQTGADETSVAALAADGGPRLCLSSSATTANRALIAWLAHDMGDRATVQLLQRLRARLGTDVVSDDDAVVEALRRDECDAGLVRHSVAARSVGGLAVQALDVTVGDLHGVGIARHATRPGAAAQFVDWLLGADGQAAYAAASGLQPISDIAGDARLADAATVGWRMGDAALLAERARYP